MVEEEMTDEEYILEHMKQIRHKEFQRVIEIMINHGCEITKRYDEYNECWGEIFGYKFKMGVTESLYSDYQVTVIEVYRLYGDDIKYPIGEFSNEYMEKIFEKAYLNAQLMEQYHG